MKVIFSSVRQKLFYHVQRINPLRTTCARNVDSLTAVGAYLRPTQRAICLHTLELSFDP